MRPRQVQKTGTSRTHALPRGRRALNGPSRARLAGTQAMARDMSRMQRPARRSSPRGSVGRAIRLARAVQSRWSPQARGDCAIREARNRRGSEPEATVPSPGPARRRGSFRNQPWTIRSGTRPRDSRRPPDAIEAPRKVVGYMRSVHPTPRSQSSASASDSSSSSPTRIFSPISPEFCRTAASMAAATSGLLRRKVLAFSRPWPMRWLS